MPNKKIPSVSILAHGQMRVAEIINATNAEENATPAMVDIAEQLQQGWDTFKQLLDELAPEWDAEREKMASKNASNLALGILGKSGSTSKSGPAGSTVAANAEAISKFIKN